MSIQSEIDRLKTAKSAISNAIENKGVAVPQDTSIDGMAALINEISSGSLYTYKGTFTVDGWEPTAIRTDNTVISYEQTVTVTSIDGGPAMSSNMFLTAPYTASTNNEDTNKTLAQALGVINTGIVTLGDGNIKIEVVTKPSCDIVVYWFGKEMVTD